jgi:hypothetical protein
MLNKESCAQRQADLPAGRQVAVKSPVKICAKPCAGLATDSRNSS